MLHRQIISVQRKSSLNRSSSRLMLLLCLAQQVGWKNFVDELVENSTVNSRLRNDFHFFSLLVGYKHTNRAGIMLDRASLFPSPALQNLWRLNTCQGNYNTALAFSILHVGVYKNQQLSVLCVQFLTWQAPPHTIDRLYNPEF